jgi:hypothetical protein
MIYSHYQRKDIPMGLDMYLEVRKYVSKFSFDKGESFPTPEYQAMIAHAPKGTDKYGDYAGISVSYPVAYWRKANAVHGWFVANVQGGVDNCESYYVSREQLAELAEACDAVLKVSVGVSQEDAAATAGLLPVQGFFFGGYEMDEWYIQDLKYTQKMINHILSVIPEGYDYSFYYHSSW